MNKVDLTTLYSAEAALELPNLDDAKYAWFIYSLASLSSSLLQNRQVFIPKPPTSIEKGVSPPGELAYLLKQNNLVPSFVIISEETKQRSVNTTLQWLQENRYYFEHIVKDSSFWNQPQLIEWLSWHKKNEWPMRKERFPNIVGPEFEGFVLSLGVREPEEMFTIDVLTRGYYYWDSSKENIWLHPVRGFYLPGSEFSQTSEAQPFDSTVIHLIMGALEEKTSLLGRSERMKYWINQIIDAQRLSEQIALNNPALHHELAKLWKIANWERRVEQVELMFNNYWRYVEPLLEVAPLSLRIAVKFLKPLTGHIAKGAEEGAKKIDQKSVERTIETGKRILLLSKKGSGSP